jgi:hypothetical protein
LVVGASSGVNIQVSIADLKYPYQVVGLYAESEERVYVAERPNEKLQGITLLDAHTLDDSSLAHQEFARCRTRS